MSIEFKEGDRVIAKLTGTVTFARETACQVEFDLKNVGTIVVNTHRLELVAPTEWPPLIGDVWRFGESTWACMAATDSGQQMIRHSCPDDVEEADQLLIRYPNVRPELVFRFKDEG